MRRVRILLVMMSLIFFNGCVTIRYIEIKDSPKEKIQLPFKIETIEIVDSRNDLLPMDWDLPFIAVRSREWNGNPEISKRNRTDINQIIKESQDSSGVSTNVEFNVLEGLCRLNSDWNSIMLYAKFKGELTIEIPSQNRKYQSLAEMNYSGQVSMMSEKEVMKLYNQAVKDVTYIAVKQIRDDL